MDGWKSHTASTYDDRGNLILETYYKNNKSETAGEYTFDETNKMVEGVNANGEQSIYSYNGLGALMENTWVIAKNGYGYHDVSATAVVEGEVVVDAETGARQEKVRLTPEELEAANAAEDAALAEAAAAAEEVAESPETAQIDETPESGSIQVEEDADTGTLTGSLVLAATAGGNGNNGNQSNGNGTQDKPTGSDVNKTSTVVKQFVVDFSREDYKPLMEQEVNGLTYRYVNSDKARLSVVVQGIENGSSSLLDANGELHAYYHTDYLGTTDYLTSAVNSKVISWTSYNEWGEITHNAVLKCGQRELDLVKEYATHDYDAVLDLYYAKARFYDAYNRTFTAQDPVLDPSQYDLREYVKEPMALVQYLYVRDNAINAIDPFGLRTVPLRELAEKYGASVTYQGATSYREARAKVTINGITKYYTATSLDGDHAFINSSHTMMYVDDDYFYEQWGIISSDTQYGIIDQAEMDAFENYEMAPASYTYLMRLTYAWYVADSAEEQATLLREANWFRGTGYSEIYFDSILCIDEEKFNEYIEFMPNLPERYDGVVLEEEHYFRNDINIEYSWAIMQKLSSTNIPEAIRWYQMAEGDSALHQHHTSGGANTKWASGDGHFEIVYNAEHVVQNAQNNPEDMGTYNFSTDGGIGHYLADVVPWISYGNTKNDATTYNERLGDFVGGFPGKVEQIFK